MIEMRVSQDLLVIFTSIGLLYIGLTLDITQCTYPTHPRVEIQLICFLLQNKQHLEGWSRQLPAFLAIGHAG